MKKVVIIDDEKDFAAFMRANLELSGEYDVVVFSTADEGLDYLAHEQPDVILLDVLIGERDGIEVLHEIKMDPHTAAIPVVMLTAMGDSVSRRRAVGAADYVIKPVSRVILMATLEKVLGAGPGNSAKRGC